MDLALAPSFAVRGRAARARIRNREGRRDRHLAANDFEELNDTGIDRLSDEQLLAYIADARDAGRPDAAMHGVRHLIWRHVDSVRARVQKKFPEHLVDDITHDILVEAIASAFDGRTIKQFFKWLNVVVSNQIADIWRGTKGKQIEFEKEHASLHADDDDEHRTVDPADIAEDGVVELETIRDEVLAEFSEAHQAAIDLRIQGYKSKEVAEMTGLSANNVDKILERFRKRLRERLEEAERGASDTDPTP